MRKKIEVSHKIPYNPNEEPQGGNLYQFATIVCLIPALIYRSKAFFWLAVFALLSGFFNKKKNE